MKRIALATVALLVTAVAVAAGMNYTWTNATQNTDNSAIPATGPGSLTQTRVEYGPCNASQTDLASITGTVVAAYPTASAASPSNLAPGTWCARAIHTNTFGVDSDPSNIVVKVIAPPKPKAPSGFTWG